jgi:hypothetical protein
LAWTCDGGSTSPATLGMCSNGGGPTGRSCFTADDCVLTEWLCTSSVGPDDTCFREYEIPDEGGAVTLPSHVLAHSDGTIWYSAYWGGNHLGRLDPATGTFQQYPLPDPVDQATCDPACNCLSTDPACPFKCCQYLLLGSGPWSLVEERRRDIVLSYQTQPAIGRFDYRRRDDPACLSLDAEGQNPCLTNHFIPNFQPDNQFTHSALVDARGNAWISVFDTSVCSASSGTVGYLQPRRNRMFMFPSFSVYPVPGGCTPAAIAGMARDPNSRGIWFADYLRKRLGHIYPVR